MARPKKSPSKTRKTSKKSKLSFWQQHQRKLTAVFFVALFGVLGSIYLFSSDAATPRNCEQGSTTCNYIATTYGKPVQATIDAVKKAQTRSRTDTKPCGHFRGCGNFGIIVGGVGIESGGLEKNPPKGQFTLSGEYSHSANDDPIVFPGKKGASHVHDFFSNTTTNYATTTDSLMKARTIQMDLGSYGGEQIGDASAYWFPAAYQNGKKLTPYGTTIYYRVPKGLEGDSAKGKQKVVPFPTGLRMIAGNAKATSSKGINQFYWKNMCSEGGNTINKSSMFFASCGKVQMVLNFPGWWDCKSLDSPDHISHMSYTKTSKHTCAVPQIQVFVQYRNDGGLGGNGFKLSSGDWYTGHGDFWNAWDPAILNALVQKLMNADVRHDAARLRRSGSTNFIQTSTPPADNTNQEPQTPDEAEPDPSTDPDPSTSIGTPQNITAKAISATEVQLDWANNGAAKYPIFRDGQWIAAPTTNTFKDENLEPGKTYQYQVQAVSATRDRSSLSSPISVNTTAQGDTQAPTAPGNFTAVHKNGQAILQWTPATDNVEVLRYNIIKDGAFYKTVEDTTLSFGDTLVEPGKTYEYRVEARDAAGNRGPSTPTLKVTIPAPEPVQKVGALYGKVVVKGSDDRISNASVTLVVDGNLYTATTNSYGNFWISNIPEGTHEVTFKHGLYQNLKTNITVSGEKTHYVAELERESQQSRVGILQGKVKDVNGSELRNVSVSTTVNGRTQTRSSNDNGNYSFNEVPTGEYRVTFKKTGYRTLSEVVRVRSGETTSVNVELRRR